MNFHYFMVEKVGDVLRYSSQWIMGLPGGDGLAATAAFTGGGPTWQCNMFDVMKAKNWEKVVEALTSNVEVSANRKDTTQMYSRNAIFTWALLTRSRCHALQTRTDEVVLLFERPLEQRES
jgi:hypothetical protein